MTMRQLFKELFVMKKEERKERKESKERKEKEKREREERKKREKVRNGMNNRYYIDYSENAIEK